MSSVRTFLLCVFVHLGCRAAPQCFSDGVPEASRKNISVGKVSLPIGLWDSDWDSALVVTRMVQVLLSEVMGFNAVVSGSAPSGASVALGLSGCFKDKDGILVCPPGALPDDHPHHVAMEYWYSAEWMRDAVRDANPLRDLELVGLLGYEGREGIYVPAVVHQVALQEFRYHLEYYGFWDAYWNPGQFFAKIANINASRLKPCSQTRLADPLEMAKVSPFTPDPDGIDDSGRAKCVDGTWWLAPACRSNASTCVPIITTGDGYYLRAMMQKAIAFNMPVAIATAPWNDYLTLPYEVRMLVYSWEPAAHFLRQSPVQLVSPPTDVAAQATGDMRTEGSSTPLYTAVASSLRAAAPRVYKFLSSLHLSEADIHSLLTFFTSVGDHYTAACSWLKSTSKWQGWIPDDRQCTPGRGLIDAAGGFVQNYSLGVSCSYCPAGYYSAAVAGMKTRVCKQCPAGTFQQLWGFDECQPCDLGLAQSGLGQVACERCGRGSFANESGSTRCMPCPHGKSTDGTGYRRSKDCLCPSGSFLDPASDKCPSCGEGALCTGFGAEPQAAEGYHLIEVLNGALRIFSCDRHNFCPGGRVGTCAEGRTGLGCSRCLKHMSPRKDGTCGACGGLEGLVLFFLILGFCIVLTALYSFSMSARGLLNSSTAMVVAGVGQTLLVLQFVGAFARVTLDWPEPLATLLKAASFMNFDFEKVVAIGCVTPLGDVPKYGAQLSFLPISCCFLLIIHTIVWACHRQTSFYQHTCSLVGTVGIVVLALYIGISNLALAPFQCGHQPSGEWTMLQNAAVICWTTESHGTLIVLGCVGLTVPVSFLAAVVRLIWIMPLRVSSGDVDFLSRFAFLLARVRVQARWFLPVVLTRNLCVALVPCIPATFWQSLLLGGLFSLSSVLVSWLKPWRVASTNWIDTLMMLCMLTFVFVSAAFLDDVHADGLVELCVAALSVSILVPCCFAALGFLQRLKNQKKFNFFICHQKSGAGASARLLKMEIVGRRSTATVFLDADDLSNLAYLFQTVREDVEVLIVLCSREVLQSSWCLGEITTAWMAKVPTLPLLFSDFTLPTEEFISHLVATPVLTENSLSIADVQRALRCFITLHREHLPEEFDEMVLRTFAHQIVSTRGTIVHTGTGMLAKPNKILSSRGAVAVVMPRLMGKFATMVPSSSPSVKSMSSGGTSKGDKVGSLLVVDTSGTEAIAAAVIFKNMLTPHCVTDGRSPPFILWPRDVCPPSCSKAVLFCTPGCFQNSIYLVTLMKLVVHGIKQITPVVISDAFAFPSPSFFAALEDSVRRLCLDAGTDVEPQLLHRFVSGVFNKICSRLSVQGSIRILQVEVAAIWEKMKNVDVDDLVDDSVAEQDLVFKAIVTKLVELGDQRRNDVTEAATATSSATAPTETQLAAPSPLRLVQQDAAPKSLAPTSWQKRSTESGHPIVLLDSEINAMMGLPLQAL